MAFTLTLAGSLSLTPRGLKLCGWHARCAVISVSCLAPKWCLSPREWEGKLEHLEGAVRGSEDRALSPAVC